MTNYVGQLSVNQFAQGTNAGASTFLRGDGSWSTVTGAGGPTSALNYDATGTPSIRSSINISSVTYSSAGKYILNFTSSYSNANYYVSFIVSDSATTVQAAFIDSLTAIPATGNLHIAVGGASFNDNTYNIILVFPA